MTQTEAVSRNELHSYYIKLKERFSQVCIQFSMAIKGRNIARFKLRAVNHASVAFLIMVLIRTSSLSTRLMNDPRNGDQLHQMAKSEANVRNGSRQYILMKKLFDLMNIPYKR